MNIETPHTTIEIKARGKTYRFHKVQTDTWLLELAGVPWLILSSNFGIFEKMTEATWRSAQSNTLASVRLRDQDPIRRVAAVRALKTKMDEDARIVFKEILLQRGEDPLVKSAIVEVLRMYPSNSNMKLLADALQKTDHRDLVEQIIKVLRLRNPKGPQIREGEDWANIQKIIDQWQIWAKQLE
jgi:hypothetical protein